MRSLLAGVVAALLLLSAQAAWAPPGGRPGYKPTGGHTSSQTRPQRPRTSSSTSDALKNLGLPSSVAGKWARIATTTAGVAVLAEVAGARERLPETFQADVDRAVEAVGSDINVSAHAATDLGRRVERIQGAARIWREEVALARKLGLAEKYLEGLESRTEISHIVANCCVFKSPWRDWRRAPERESMEAAFVDAAMKERWPKSLQKFLVVPDQVHVTSTLRGTDGIPTRNRVNADAGRSASALKSAILKLGRKSKKTAPVEMYILAPFIDGHIVLRDGSRLKADNLIEIASKHGVRLHVWGCHSGLDASSGIREAYDVIPLVQAVGKALRSAAVKSRLSFYQAIHEHTGLHLVFDVLALKHEEGLLRARLELASSGAPISFGANGKLTTDVERFDIAVPRISLNAVPTTPLAPGSYPTGPLLEDQSLAPSLQRVACAHNYPVRDALHRSKQQPRASWPNDFRAEEYLFLDDRARALIRGSSGFAEEQAVSDGPVSGCPPLRQFGRDLR